MVVELNHDDLVGVWGADGLAGYPWTDAPPVTVSGPVRRFLAELGVPRDLPGIFRWSPGELDGVNLVLGYAWGDQKVIVYLDSVTDRVLVRNNYAPPGTGDDGYVNADIASFVYFLTELRRISAFYEELEEEGPLDTDRLAEAVAELRERLHSTNSEALAQTSHWWGHLHELEDL